MVATDVAHVMRSWMTGLRSADRGALPDDLFFSSARELVRRILADRAVSVLVAHLPGDPHKIIGYGVAEPGVALHWISVKPLYRGQGVARSLLLALRCPPEVPRTHRSRQDRILLNPLRPQLCRDRYRSGS